MQHSDSKRSSGSQSDPQQFKIRLLVMDVDGVLTDASINLDDAGREIKRFNVRDGLAISTWLHLDLHVGVITRRSGGAVKHRMNELGVKHVIQGSKNKGAAVQTLAKKLKVPLRQTAFIGDDWPDLPAMKIVGLPIAVADADPVVKDTAAYITQASGGQGAVREVVEMLLHRQGLFERAVRRFDPSWKPIAR